MTTTNTIIVGAGVSGIAMAHTLKCRLGYTDFEASSNMIQQANAMVDNFLRSLKNAIPLEALGKPIHILDGKAQEYHTLSNTLTALKRL